MNKKYIDAEALKEHISSFTGMFTDEGFMVDMHAVLGAIDFMAYDSAIIDGDDMIDIERWKRKLHRDKKRLKLLQDDEANLSKWGQHDLGYFKGMVAVVEDLFDELGIDIED